MKIGIDISQSVYEGTGVARFTKGLVNAIADYENRDQWSFFFSSLRRPVPSELSETIKSKHWSIHTRSFPPSVLSVMWNVLGIVPVDSMVKDVDWFITSDWAEAPTLKTKKATVIHDLAFIRYPETVHPFVRFTQTLRLKRVKKETSLIITDAQVTKDDLISYLHVPENKIHVIYPGVDITEPSNAALIAVKEKYHITKPYILSVGKIEPRKNLVRLVEAFHNLRSDTAELLIVGPSGWGDQMKNIENPNCRLLGYVPNQDLAVLYRLASVFAYPSLWEGFGYPVAEAMKYGVAVACSDIPSLKEIAGDAALYFDPLSVEEISKSLAAFLENPEKQKIYGQKAMLDAKRFAWKQYHEKLMRCLHAFKT